MSHALSLLSPRPWRLSVVREYLTWERHHAIEDMNGKRIALLLDLDSNGCYSERASVNGTMMMQSPDLCFAALELTAAVQRLTVELQAVAARLPESIVRELPAVSCKAGLLHGTCILAMGGVPCSQ